MHHYINIIKEKDFTESEINHNQASDYNHVSKQHIGDNKRKKLMSVLNDLVELRKKINQGE